MNPGKQHRRKLSIAGAVAAVVVAVVCAAIAVTVRPGSQPARQPDDALGFKAALNARHWRWYKERYADRELEIKSYMVDVERPEPIALVHSYDEPINRVMRHGERDDVIWSCDMPESVHSVRPPAWAMDSGRVYVVQGRGLAALDAATGGLLWISDGPNDCIAAVADLVVAGDCGSGLESERWAVARHGDTGEVAWRVQLPDDIEPATITALGDFIWIMCNDHHGSVSYLVEHDGNVIAKLDEFVIDIRVEGDDFLIVSDNRVFRMHKNADIVWELPRGSGAWYPFSTGKFAPGPDGDLVVCFYGPISDSGVDVVRLRPHDGSVVWQAHCRSLGVLHSMYRHCVYAKVMDEQVIVVSQGFWYFVEVLDVDTGSQLERIEFNRDYAYEHPGR